MAPQTPSRTRVEGLLFPIKGVDGNVMRWVLGEGRIVGRQALCEPANCVAYRTPQNQRHDPNRNQTCWILRAYDDNYWKGN